MIYSDINNYTPVKTPCTIHHIGGTRYMYDTEHTFTMYQHPDLLFDDVTGEVYYVSEFINGTDTIEIIEYIHL